MPKKSPFAIVASKSTELKKLRREVDELRRVGQQLSNVAYNLAQEGSKTALDSALKMSLDRLRREWDAIERTPR